MIHISKPLIEDTCSGSSLKAVIVDDVRQSSFELWYSVQPQYKSYLCDDYADSFVLAVLPLAMKSGQDIVVEAPVSSNLLFNLSNTVQPIYAKQDPSLKQVNIVAQPSPHIRYHNGGVGCCCSLGVDSFSTFLRHNSSDVPEDYRVTHLTLFNSGQLGYKDVEGTRRFFHQTIEDLKTFSQEVGLPILAVDSNINELFFETGVSILQSVRFRTISCALALQKLFAKYAYASSYSIENIKLCADDDGYAEATYAPLLSTENTEVIFSDPAKTRVEKTAFISQYPITYKYLDVCWSGQMAYGKDGITTLLQGKSKKNCGKCEKCLRTIMTLDLLGMLKYYEDLFDLDYYKQHRDRYVAKLLASKKSSVFSAELLAFMAQKGEKPSLWARILSIKKRSMFLTHMSSILKGKK